LPAGERDPGARREGRQGFWASYALPAENVWTVSRPGTPTSRLPIEGELVDTELAIVTIAQIGLEWSDLWREADRLAASEA